jgi:uncharacterized protein YukE
MNQMIGADVAELRALAAQFSQASDRLLGVAQSVRQGIQVSAWVGPVAVRFRHLWDSEYSARLRNAASLLEQQAQALQAQATQQEGASKASTGAIGNALGTPMAGGVASHSDATMLEFAKLAYGGDNLPSGWHSLSDDELRKLNIDPASLHGNENSTALDGRIFSDGNGHYVLAFSGSQGDMFRPYQSDSVDWLEDYKSAATVLPINASLQAQQAADVAYQLKSTVGVDNIEIVGHSLGGRDAAVAAAATGAHAVTFNAAAPTDEDLLYARALRGDNANIAEYALSKVTGGQSIRSGIDESMITNYVSSDDPLTFAELVGQQFGGRTALGHLVAVQGSGHGHGLESFDGRVPGGGGGRGW